MIDLTCFCTIITKDYVPFAKVLYNSISQFKLPVKFVALIVNSNYSEKEMAGIQWMNLEDLMTSDLSKEIISTNLFKSTNDELRWALKPVLIAQLLYDGFEKVLYIDPDIYFVGNPQFLINELNENAVLLSPHWQNIDSSSPYSAISLLKGGFFNAGFIGATKIGLPAIEWWARMCNFKTEKDDSLGIYDDQKYLDLIPWEFEKVKILTHKGCNIASWNMDTNERSIIDGKLIIAKDYEPVFIHFTAGTIENILNGKDKLLLPLWKNYKTNFINEGFDIQQLIKKYNLHENPSIVLLLKHKALIRTRIKRFLTWILSKL